MHGTCTCIYDTVRVHVYKYACCKRVEIGVESQYETGNVNIEYK